MKQINKNLWKKIAYLSAGFGIFVAILLIINYVQYSKLDPVNAKLIENLVERLNEDPNNEALRQEIRTIDLLSRKAYFTSQWQIKMGGYLLLVAVIVFVIAMQILLSGKREVEYIEKDDVFFAQAKARRWVALGGLLIVCFAMLSAYLSYQQLENSFLTNFSKKGIKKDSTENNSVKLENNLASEEIMDSLETSSNVDSATANLTPFPTAKENAENYPTFRGIGGNGIVYKKNVPTSWNGASKQNILWKLKLPLLGYNSPIIWGDKLFLSGADESKREIYCIDRNTGKLLWRHQVKNINGSPASAPKVTADTGHAAPTLATDGRRVYAIFSNGDILATDMEGNRVWARNLGVLGNHYGHSSSLMLFQDKLIVQYDQKSEAKIMALNTLTGKTIWSTPRKVKISWASPIVVYTGKQSEIILAADPFIASYNPYTGKENWKIDCIFGEVGPSPAYADGIVFATNEYANLTAIKLGETPEILWQTDEYLSDVPSPIATKDYLFLVTSYGAVACYGAKDGKKLWEHEFPNGFYGSPVLVNNNIYLVDMKGNTHIFSASDKFKLIGTNALGENSTCTPAFADGRIYIRGKENLYCIGK